MIIKPIIIFLLISGVAGQAGADAFRYRPAKVSVGTVYHYLKTNIDGTRPEHVSIYVAAKDRIESFKYHPKEEPAALVTATMDWSTFSARRLESWHVFASGEKKLVATLDYLPAQKAVEVAFPATGRPNEKTPIPRLPFHIYNFDLASLNFAFPHLADPLGSFTVGIADPTFKDEGPLFHYKGEAHVSYEGEESRQGAICRKYRIDGKGLEGRGGTIWVNREGGYFQDVEIDLPDNPAWRSFKFKLKGVGRMTRAQWEAFMKAQF
ncbi:MAG TPA: hypothetical protein VE262_11120 [Blastocatellia bacterium]|nr:hypothetical protein [Blastocatellia bacterium]